MAWQGYGIAPRSDPTQAAIKMCRCPSLLVVLGNNRLKTAAARLTTAAATVNRFTFSKMNGMARLLTPPPFTGTVGPITVYYMFGRYYIRSRSSLSAQRVQKDPAFRKTRQYAALLANASRIASAVYAAIPAQHKTHKHYRKLTGEAMTWLKYDWKTADIIDYLLRQYANTGLPLEAPATKLRPSYRRARPISNSTLPNLAKTTPGKPVPFELRQWRRRDKQFRLLHKLAENADVYTSEAEKT